MDRRAEFLLAVAATSLRGGTADSIKNKVREKLTSDPIGSVLMTLLDVALSSASRDKRDEAVAGNRAVIRVTRWSPRELALGEGSP